MPYELHWEHRGVYRKYIGDVSMDQRAESHRRICANPRFDSLRYTITCYLDVQAYETAPDEPRETAALHIGPLVTNPHIILAAVAVRPDILGYIAAFQATGFVRQPYRVFAGLEEARAWIAQMHPGLGVGGGQG